MEVPTRGSPRWVTPGGFPVVGPQRGSTEESSAKSFPRRVSPKVDHRDGSPMLDLQGVPTRVPTMGSHKDVLHRGAQVGSFKWGTQRVSLKV